MDTVLVTGGAGFIGGHLVDELLNNYKVIGVDNMSSGLDSTMKSHIAHANFIPAFYDITSDNLERVFQNNEISMYFIWRRNPE
jgi:nucleoside-diphosphate-sugar epimerase